MRAAALLASALLVPGVLSQQPAAAPSPALHTVPDAPALPTSPHHEANFDAEAQQANALFASGKRLESLDLYADLCRQDPTVGLFAERHGVALLLRYSDASVEQKDRFNAFIQGLSELHRAQSLGDDSHELRGMITVAEKTPIGAIITGIPLTVGYTYQGNPAAQATMRKAEAVFAQNPAEAAKLYATAAAQDPAFYNAALFAGDAFYRSKDYAAAPRWFERAAAIDPDRETAYRYWADALFHTGDIAGSRPLVVKAFLAEPYSVATQAELRGWASTAHATLTSPQVQRQEFRTREGRIGITPPPSVPEDGTGRTAWFVYQRVRVSHGTTSFIQNVPPAGSTAANGDFVPSGYLHTLAEEMDALTQTLEDIDKKLAAGTVTQEKLSPTFKTLLQLRKDNMLECYILLNASDLGLRHDYPRYRATHRDLLTAYVDKYILPSPAPPAAH